MLLTHFPSGLPSALPTAVRILVLYGLVLTNKHLNGDKRTDLRKGLALVPSLLEYKPV